MNAREYLTKETVLRLMMGILDHNPMISGKDLTAAMAKKLDDEMPDYVDHGNEQSEEPEEQKAVRDLFHQLHSYMADKTTGKFDVEQWCKLMHIYMELYDRLNK